LKEALASSSSWSEVVQKMPGRRVDLLTDRSRALGCAPSFGVLSCRFSSEEDEILRDPRKTGMSWAEIAAIMPGRSDRSCEKHWHVLTGGGEVAGKWDEAKTAALKAAVAELGNHWKEVGERLGLRPSVCSDKWVKLAKENNW
jgi:hypothetical protein